MGQKLEPLYSPQQVAEHFGLKASTLAAWRRSSTGPKYVRLGGGRGLIRYRLSDLETWLQENTANERTD